ncbi:MAG: MBL fold metallo-hydrolase [Chloroflexi bacterium]|nr:MBL fold metallo-hydrolase [Chloroflexota bacterium]
MEPQIVVPGVYMLNFEIGQVYLWDWDTGLTVVDTGIAGSDVPILEAVTALGHPPEYVKEIVLSHFHDDHRGGVAALAERTGATVIAHRMDAPVIRGVQQGAPPVLMDFERPIAEAVMPRVPPALPAAVDREVEDGDTVAGGGSIVGVPGHTPGSIALLVPSLGVLFTGDTLASVDGAPILGVFNVDRAAAIQSLHKQAGLAFDVACFGHGAPLVGGASARIRMLAEGF